jgi:hypothetical protein
MLAGLQSVMPLIPKDPKKRRFRSDRCNRNERMQCAITVVIAVDVHRRADVRMSHSLLLHGYRRSHSVKTRSVAVAHRVSSQLADFRYICCFLEYSLNSRIGPRKTVQLRRGSQNPVSRFGELRCLLLRLEHFQQAAIYAPGLSGTCSLYVIHSLPAIVIRHALVHRNGKTKEGEDHALSQKVIEDFIHKRRDFVKHIEPPSSSTIEPEPARLPKKNP